MEHITSMCYERPSAEIDVMAGIKYLCVSGSGSNEDFSEEDYDW